MWAACAITTRTRCSLNRILYCRGWDGGHAAGEVAAAIAIDAFAVLAGRYDVTADELHDCVATANRAVLQAGLDDPDAEGLGTTVSGAVVSMIDGEPHWLIVNVGDSRTYLRSGGGLTRRTIDHSEVEELVIAGYLTAAEARVHPRRNVVTRSLGSDPRAAGRRLDGCRRRPVISCWCARTA